MPNKPTRKRSDAEVGQLADELISRHLRGADLFDDEIPLAIGRYRVLRPLGRGAYGRVYLAEDPTLGRPVAIKVLARPSPGSQKRFRREMKALARLEHPGIVRIYDAGIVDGGPYFVMEFVDQPQLDEANLDLDGALDVVEDVARACHAAHQSGVVHRDLKPANVLVGERTVVVDFGIAKLLGDGGSDTRSPVGTPEYMSPEQLTGAEIGPWTDTHALGALLYEALTGWPPFEGDNVAEVLKRVRTANPLSPVSVNPGLPAGLGRLAMRALSKSPADRPSSAKVFADELRTARAGGA